MKLPVLVFGFVIVVSAVVLLVSVVELVRLRYDKPPRTRRHRSRFSLRRARHRASHSLRTRLEGPERAVSRNFTR